MDPNIGEQLQKTLEKYVLNTLKYIETVRSFCYREPKWTHQRKSELERMRDIKDQADQICLKLDYVKKAENKAKAAGQYLWNGVTQVTADSKREKLEEMLKVILEDTVQGLKRLQDFLNAVEMLAVTSLSVFEGKNFLPMGAIVMGVRSVISVAKEVCPHLIHFKRDADTFFLPSLSNVEVLIFQLDKYISVTQQLCERLKDIAFSGNVFEWKKSLQKFNLNRSQESLQTLHNHLSQLSKIRMDESFRMTFLFHSDAQRFIGIFSQCRSRMIKFLSDLEDTAGKLDNMKTGSSISTVAGSSVGIAGGVASIVGLALAPFTAGVSLTLTLTGIGLGITSGVNSIVTGITEMAYNRHHGKNGNEIFHSFMKDVQKLLGFLEQVASNEGPVAKPQAVVTALEAENVIARIEMLGKSVDAIVDGASAIKTLKSEEMARTAVTIGLEAKAARNIPNLAADLPYIGQLAKGTRLALSKSARASFITLNALFIGLDVAFICKESWSLAKGEKSEAALFIRSRAALWRSELEAWDKINESLCKGIWKFHKNQKIQEQPFLPKTPD